MKIAMHPYDAFEPQKLSVCILDDDGNVVQRFDEGIPEVKLDKPEMVRSSEDLRMADTLEITMHFRWKNKRGFFDHIAGIKSKAESRWVRTAKRQKEKKRRERLKKA